MDIELFVFLAEALQFSRFRENESKHDQLNFKRGSRSKIRKIT